MTMQHGQELFDRTPILVPPSQPPTLFVVVDTEEEFDWDAEFDSEATSVEAMSHIHLAQEIFEEYGIRPTYVIDFPVASQPRGYEPLLEYHGDGRAEIGAHLHPWVSPPIEERICQRNSFAGNLPSELEFRKLSRLRDEIERSFGFRTTVYKAGRYGLGPHTPAALGELGFEVDLSACPLMDFSPQEGPDYSGFSSQPYWFGQDDRLLGLPMTCGFVGLARRRGATLHEWCQRSPWRQIKLPAILSRAGVIERLVLSPEGFELEEMKRLTRTLVGEGLRTFSFAFHSPSLQVGNTSYVTSRTELESFLARMRSYFEFFLTEVGGTSSTPLELKTFFHTLERRDDS